MKQILFFLIIQLTLIPISYAQNNLLNNLQQFPVATGEFTQKKHFKVLKKPIVSKGKIFLDKKLGLVWQTNFPIFSQLILKSDGIYNNDGINPIHKIKADNTLVKTLMYAILGDVSTLHEQFETVVKNNQDCLILTPKNTQLKKIITSIKLCGYINKKQLVEKVTLFEKNNNTTEIALTLTPSKTLPEAIRVQLQ